MEDGVIAERLAQVRRRVASAARAAGREPEQVRLIAVSKSKPAEAVRAAYEAGQRDFGENYVQEFVAKAQALSDLPDLRWHMIGHLQTNKVKQVIGVAHLVHTVDRVKLARELGKRVAGAGRVMDVLVEVNVGGEESKTGSTVEGAAAVVEAVRSESALRLLGLMTVPPFDLDVSEVAVHFDRLRLLALEFGVPELSMGMSHDYEEAIARGATMVRVGTAIFGGRG
jgi:PLP dependent protein